MVLTLEEKEKYFRGNKKIGKVIISHVKKRGLILFGQKSVNKQLPKHLQKHTEDYDIYSSTPKRTARRIERKLDKKFGGNYFLVRKAKHPGTHKVISQIGDKGIADVSKPEDKVPTIKRKGLRLATLEYQKQRIRKSLRDKASAFRHAKDKEVRDRIKLFEQKKRVKKKFKKRTFTQRTQRAFQPLRLRMPKL